MTQAEGVVKNSKVQFAGDQSDAVHERGRSAWAWQSPR